LVGHPLEKLVGPPSLSLSRTVISRIGVRSLLTQERDVIVKKSHHHTKPTIMLIKAMMEQAKIPHVHVQEIPFMQAAASEAANIGQASLRLRHQA
jgi:hypothetical protein